MRDIVDIVLLEEVRVDNPRRLGHDLVHPATMTRRLEALIVGENGARFMLFTELIGTYSHKEIDRGEGQFRLSQLQGVANDDESI